MYESPNVTMFLNCPGLGPTAKVDCANDKNATIAASVPLGAMFDEVSIVLFPHLIPDDPTYTSRLGFRPVTCLSSILLPETDFRLTCP